jgi:hypothetical protein
MIVYFTAGNQLKDMLGYKQYEANFAGTFVKIMLLL